MDTLHSLPKDLEATYDQILHRIDGREMPPAKVILQWLVLGMRPLTIPELTMAVTFDPLTGKFDSSLGLAHPDDVIQVCSSLVTRAANNTVQLAHASVKEYFLSKPRRITLSDTETGHGLIVNCCLQYLLQCGWHSDKHSDFPLLQYTAQFWPDHYKCSSKTSTLHDLVVEFFQVQNGIFEKWIKIHSGTQRVLILYQQGIPIHYAALLGLQDIISKLWRDDQLCTVMYSITMQIAAMAGHIDIVEFLLDNKVDVNHQVGHYGSALQAASSNGYVTINTLYAPMRRYPVCFSLLLYYDATLPMLD